MPRVTSDWEARQEEHVLDGLGAMGVAQQQHRMVAVVPTPVKPGWTVGSAISMLDAGIMILYYY